METEEPFGWPDVWKRLRQVGERAVDAAQAWDTDRALQTAMAGVIEASAARHPVDPGATWAPGSPLKLLFAGYTGTRNTGADVRVEEMIRQVRHLLTDDHCELYLSTIDPKRSAGYFRSVSQLHLPQVFPRFVFDTVHQVHGVVACEGSMFKSTFANALSTYMVGALGCAVAERKVAIGYGGEAGKMDESLKRLVRDYLQGAYILCRNRSSVDVLAELGVDSEAGTDTAWTFEPAPAEVGAQILSTHGWDGNKPVVVLCPINAFWWPVKPDIVKGVLHQWSGAYGEDHYDSVYFHRGGEDVRRRQNAYIEGLASGFNAVQARHDVFPVVVGMEALDRSACESLAAKIDAPVLCSDDFDMYQLVSVLRRAQSLLSSRYHAIVCSMPAQVASAGVTMDERIRNLMVDRGTPELALEVDDPDLATNVERVLERLVTEGDGLSDGIGRTVASQLEIMGRMGALLVDHLRNKCEGLPIDSALGSHGDPWAHLPKMGADASRLAREFA